MTGVRGRRSFSPPGGGHFRAGELLGALQLPTIALQEGGYHLPTLGSLVRATLEGLAR